MSTSNEVEQLNQRIARLEMGLQEVAERNQRVALQKAWETSKVRIISIVILTYALMCLIFWVLGVNDFASNAIIPTIGYYLSTQSLPAIKAQWLKWQSKKLKSEHV